MTSTWIQLCRELKESNLYSIHVELCQNRINITGIASNITVLNLITDYTAYDLVSGLQLLVVLAFRMYKEWNHSRLPYPLTSLDVAPWWHPYIHNFEMWYTLVLHLGV